MKMIKRMSLVAVMGLAVLSLQGCFAEVGSKEWCADLKEKPKGDWSANEAKDYAKHCIF